MDLICQIGKLICRRVPPETDPSYFHFGNTQNSPGMRRWIELMGERLLHHEGRDYLGADPPAARCASIRSIVARNHCFTFSSNSCWLS